MSQSSPLTPALQRAQALVAAGDLGGALVLLERAVELGRENLAEDHLDVLTAQRELAGVLLQVEEPVGARRALEEAYAAGQWRLGDSDPLMLRISHDLGVVAEELGNRHEARKAFGRVVDLGPAVLGEQHPVVARARAYLGQDQDQAEVRDAAPTPETPLTVRAVPSMPPAPVAPPPQPDPMNAPTGVFPTVPAPVAADQTLAAGPWNGPPGQVAPRQAPPRQAPPRQEPPVQEQQPAPPQWHGQPPAPNQWQEQRPVQNAWQNGATVQPPPADLTPWTGDDHHGRNVPGGVTIWQGAPPAHPQPPTVIHTAASIAHSYPMVSDVQPAQRAPESGRRRGMAVFAVIAATLSAVVAVAALVFVLADRVGDNGGGVVPTGEVTEPGVPTQDEVPPGEISLDDQGATVEVRWTDPAQGRVPFMVTMARPGETLRPVSSVGPGETSFRMGGLNKKLNYCFAVVAVYATDRFKSSDQVCTDR
ncbi:tetratricopeptide repeat protein [Actinoplanes sp. GCM10030250]|uniref:tetratricopeptide repeat protein n=1 Tax=Actinoplanes sp. GCM10030250 TaxID=3273376 RepID=UPI00361E13EC